MARTSTGAADHRARSGSGLHELAFGQEFQALMGHAETDAVLSGDFSNTVEAVAGEQRFRGDLVNP